MMTVPNYMSNFPEQRNLPIHYWSILVGLRVKYDNCHRDMMANEHNMVGTRPNSYEKVKKNNTSVHEEIKCSLKARNLSYYSTQTF